MYSCVDCENVAGETYKQWIDHLQSYHHQVNIAKAVWLWSAELNASSVVVTGSPDVNGEFGELPTSLFNVLMHFSQFGAVSNAFYHPSQKFCIIQMEKREFAGKILAIHSCVIEGVPVEIRLKSTMSPEDWFKLSSCSKGTEVESATEIFNKKHNWLINEICDLDYDTQLDRFITLLTMSESDFTKREQVRSELLSIIGEHYPAVKIMGMGDVITGLGDSDSILDLCFDLPEASINQVIIENIHQLIVSTNGIYKEVSLVPNTPLSYIKANHGITGVKVQLWFNTFTRVYSSKLIQFLISLDSRVLPLMLIIRYWASYNVQPPNHIDNYTFELLTLTYLTCVEILPTIYYLQDLSPIKLLVDKFWNVSFSTDHKFIVEDLKGADQKPVEISETTGKPTTESMLYLLKYFFRMYARLEFQPTFVCSVIAFFAERSDYDVDNEKNYFPKVLRPYKRWALSREKEDRMKTDTPMLVQDPFNLGVNVAADVTEVSILTFQNACFNSADVLQKIEDIQAHTDKHPCFIDFVVLTRDFFPPGNDNYNKDASLESVNSTSSSSSSSESKTESESESESDPDPEEETIEIQPTQAENSDDAVYSPTDSYSPIEIYSPTDNYEQHQNQNLEMPKRLRTIEYTSPSPENYNNPEPIIQPSLSFQTFLPPSLSIPHRTCDSDSMHPQQSLSPQPGFSGAIMRPSLNTITITTFPHSSKPKTVTDNSSTNLMEQQMPTMAKFLPKNQPQPSGVNIPMGKTLTKRQKNLLRKETLRQKARQREMLRGSVGTAPDGQETFEFRMNHIIKPDFSYCFSFIFTNVATKEEIEQKCTALWLSIFKDFFIEVWETAFKVSIEPNDSSEILDKLQTERANTITRSAYTEKQIRRQQKMADKKHSGSLTVTNVRQFKPVAFDEDKFDADEINSNINSHKIEFNPHQYKLAQLPPSEQFCQSFLVRGCLDVFQPNGLRVKIFKGFRGKFLGSAPLERHGLFTERMIKALKIRPNTAVNKEFIATAKVDTTKSPAEILVIFTETPDCQGMNEIFYNMFTDFKNCLSQYQNHRLNLWLKEKNTV